MSGSGAPIFAAPTEAHARAESAAWAQFAAAREPSEFYASWLSILCAQIRSVDGAMLLLEGAEGAAYAAAAVWPDAGRDMRHLAPVAERTLKERRGLVVGRDATAPPQAGQGACIGYPIEADNRLRGAVVLELPPQAGVELQRALRLLHWASVWLVDRFRQRELASMAARLERVALAQQLLATSLQERRLRPSALALVNDIATRLGCQRVSLGFERGGSIVLQAISHTATFDARTDLARHLADAMDEVLDLDQPVRLPPPPGADTVDAAQAAAHAELAALARASARRWADTVDAAQAAAHAELAALARASALLSVPLRADAATVGVLTLERHDGAVFDDGTAELATMLGTMLGPIFAIKRDNERGPWRRTADRVRDAGRALVAPGHPGAKLGAVASLALVAVLVGVDVPYRVSGKAVIEGESRRATVAPFDGYIDQALVRAGDTVRRGQVMARLLDRDLKLEQARWTVERDVAQRRLRQAAAAQERAAMAMATAQIEQAQAQLSLVDEKLARTALTAPFDGIVVAGDLAPLLGSPVEQGKVLFEVAPLDRWRVLLEVDERDIGWLAPGQRGELVVAGVAGETMPFEVRQVTPIASAQDGRNHFRVEAQIDEVSPRLRPGMEGVGKVTVGRRSLLWIWTHPFTDWLRLALWRWAP